MERDKITFGKDDETDLMPLYHLLVSEGIPCKMRQHPVAKAEPMVVDLIGYFPTGPNQILIDEDDTTYSIIRGAVSFGKYEIMNIGKGEKFKEPERFETPEGLVSELKKSSLPQKML